MKIGIITGTRPDIIKMAPLYWEGKKRGHGVFLIHSMQHFPYSLFECSYRDLDLTFPPQFMLNNSFMKTLIMRISKNKKLSEKLMKLSSKYLQPNIAQTFLKLYSGFSDFFRKNKFDIVLTHGDTFTCSTASLAAHLNNIPVGHIEAGLRTGCREPFPEQSNTRITDVCSDLYFAAIEKNKQFLINEGFPKENIFVVGNSVVDAVNYVKKKSDGSFFKKIGIDIEKPFIYFSAHRKENMMHKERFVAIVKAVSDISEEYQVLWSIRPATRKALNDYGIGINRKNLFMVEEIPRYSDIVWFMANSKLIVTDSGSMQEESAALEVPCITLRYVTDRPETVEAGINFLAKPSKDLNIMEIVKKALSIKKWPEIYGKNVSSEIFDVLESRKGNLIRWEHEKN